jgi:hypothetical protein
VRGPHQREARRAAGRDGLWLASVIEGDQVRAAARPWPSRRCRRRRTAAADAFELLAVADVDAGRADATHAVQSTQSPWPSQLSPALCLPRGSPRPFS